MIITQLRHRIFVNMALDLMSAQYNRNRARLHELMNNVNAVPEPISSILDIKSYLYKESDMDEVRRLVRDQIKINKMMNVGKDMIKDTTHMKDFR